MPDYDVFINMQGDEPMIDPKTVQQLVDYYLQGGTSISTLYEKILPVGSQLKIEI